MNTLRVNEIFLSIQGESLKSGLPTVFIRLTGCPLRCVWCDTAYAFHEGKSMDIESILQEVRGHACPNVTVTGGEPLAQKQCVALLRELCDQEYAVSLETSGALSLEGVDHRVMKIVDVKAPGSGEEAKNRGDITDFLLPHDQLKFVLRDRADYEWACDRLRQEPLADYCEILFSPVWEELSPRELAEWMLKDGVPARLQLQLHKLLWGEERGR